MQPADALGALLEAAAEAGARKALAAVGRDADGAELVPIKAAPVSYRAILAAEHAGEITVYRRGHAAFVKRAELERWIVAGALAPEPASDDVGELVDFNARRRARGRR